VVRAGCRINVNNASQAELDALPGVGPGIARRIIEGRPYRSVDELDQVTGIAKKRLEEMRPDGMANGRAGHISPTSQDRLQSRPAAGAITGHKAGRDSTRTPGPRLRTTTP